MSMPAATKTLILTQVGDTAAATCAGLIETIWTDYADYGVVHPRLQRYYTQRECIDIVLGVLREQIDAGLDTDIELKAQQKVLNLQAQRAACQNVIDRIESQLRSARAPLSGTLTTTEISTPPTGDGTLQDILAAPDGNDPQYRGWPYTLTRCTP